MSASNRLFGAYEQRAPGKLRERALASVLEHIDYEDRTTSFIRIGPVNAVLNTIVHCFRHDPGSRERVARSLAALDGYLWHGPNGVVVNGYNSTALWDTAFAVQALFATGRAHRHPRTLERANDFIRDNQVLEDVPERERFFRHRSAGGWPFSNRPHGWPISDCTAEGLKAALLLSGHVAHPVPEPRLGAAVELLLSWQNDDGGWATYENRRGPRWLERLNPSQIFSDIMVDYSYVECTSACVQALVAARHRALPVRSAQAVDRSIERGLSFLRRAQRADGSFEGSWAVCFTYGTWFGVSGLAGDEPGAQGNPWRRGTRVGARCRSAVERAADFLERVQRVDGSWGEHFTSATERRYVQTDGQVVNTSWALLGLARGGRAQGHAALRGARHLIDRQEADGSWPRQNICGVFNKTTLIHYDNYRRYFPLWALGLMAPRS
jgi:squalene/oxidosqualene cyclase-like protein